RCPLGSLDARRRRHHPRPLRDATHEQPRDRDDLRGHRGDARPVHRPGHHRHPRLPMNGPTARVCLVTGAGRGTGATIARLLSAGGHRVALNARGRDDLEALAAELPGPALVVPGDMTDEAQVERVYAGVEREWEPVEVLVINAGAGT